MTANPRSPVASVPRGLGRRRCGALLAALLLPAIAPAQASALEAAQLLPGALASGEAGGVQWDPYVAAGGPGALAVWLDFRAEFQSPLSNQGATDVYAMRLDANGQPLDASALRMPHAIGDKTFPKAAWNGSAWLVVWENQQPLGTSSFFRRILGVRVAGSGAVLDATPIVIKDDLETTGNTMAVASDGAGWVVTVQGDALSPGAIMALAVAANGAVTNPGGTMLANLSSAIFRPDLDYANGTYLLVYSSGTTQGLRFSASLVPSGAPFVIGTGSTAMPRVATDGTDFLVAWVTQGLGHAVRARRVTAATGAMSATLLVTPDTNGDHAWDPDVAWSQGTWFVACRNSVDSTYRIARISALPAVLDFGGVVMPFGPAVVESRCRLAPTAGGVAAVFELEPQTTLWPGKVLASHVDAALAAAPPVVLSKSPPRQGFPALASSGNGYLAAFVSEVDETIEIQVQRLDARGVAIDPQPRRLARHPRYQRPAVAWNGKVFLVVFEDPVVPSFDTDDRVLGIRVAADGQRLDAVPFVVMEGSWPDVAAQGDQFLVVASRAPSTPQIRHVFAQRVRTDGTLIGASTQLGASFARFPHVAPLGTGWVVAWQRSFSHDSPLSVAEAALVDANGAPAPSFVVAGSGTLGGASRPDVAAAGGSALLVWQDNVAGVGGRLLQGSGTLQGSFPIAPLPAKPTLPAVAWDGARYLVAWQDARHRVGLWDRRWDVFAARVTAGGAVLDAGGGFAVAADYETESMPCVAGADGHTVIAWSKFAPLAPHATLRVEVRRHAPVWADLGYGLAGTTGTPTLAGSGSLTIADPGALTLANGLANASAVVAIGFARTDTAFFGGTMVPAHQGPLGFTFGLSTGAGGTFVVPLPVLPLLGGVDFFAQTWLVDPAGPFGLAASNAVRGRLP